MPETSSQRAGVVTPAASVPSLGHRRRHSVQATLQSVTATTVARTLFSICSQNYWQFLVATGPGGSVLLRGFHGRIATCIESVL